MKQVPFIQNFKTIILANGAFPESEVSLSFLKKADRIICCDGAAELLLGFGMEPDYIVGDLDSLSPDIKQKYSGILFHDPDQEINDLTKSVRFCVSRGWRQITILGATGKREDHSLGNISLLADYIDDAEVQMVTDFGVFVAVFETSVFESFAGQQVSIFSLSPESALNSENLQYPLRNLKLSSWWQGTLNKSLENQFVIEPDNGKVIVFREY